MEAKCFILLCVWWMAAAFGTETGCGRKAELEHSGKSRIVGGEDAPLGAWPWQVSLQWMPAERHMCGASILTKTWIISAAHCFADVEEYSEPSKWRAVFGLRELKYFDSWTSVRDIGRIILHEEYNRPDNDVALLKLVEAISFGDFIKPICFPSVDTFDYNMWKGCYVTGWGVQEEHGKVAPVLQQAALNLIPPEVCKGTEMYGDSITENMICAGHVNGGIDACQGDSGGPLSCHPESTSNYFLIGIVSWGEGCGQAFKPGVYTFTSKYINWVKKHMTMGERQETDTKKNSLYSDVQCSSEIWKFKFLL